MEPRPLRRRLCSRIPAAMINGKKLHSAQEAFALLNCHRLPARLNTSEVAVMLGFQEHDIGPLVSAKLLMPLGKPAANAPKYFAAIDVMACTENREWLSQATKAITNHWASKNRLRIGDAKAAQS